MSLNTSEAIYEQFRKATREHLVKRLQHDGDRKRFIEIAEEAQSRTDQEMADWQQSYHSRLAEAKQIILREAHGNILEAPKQKNVETLPDKDALNFRADQRIRNDHQRRLAVIKQDELDQYEDLKQLIDRRSRVKGQAKQAFEQERTRSGPTRD